MTPHKLLPGDMVQQGVYALTFICQVDPHPYYPSLVLVIWHTDDGWLFEAVLSRDQILPGVLLPSTDRMANLDRIFTNQRMPW